MSQLLEIPEHVLKIMTFISRLPPDPVVWRRLRIAMTLEEIASYKEYTKSLGFYEQFVWAIRAIPIEQDPEPLNPSFRMEPF